MKIPSAYRSHTRIRASREMGFSLVEVLIAILLTGIVSTAIYSIYNTFFKQSQTSEMVLESQQNARVAIEMMERELMNAGYAASTTDIITEAAASAVEFIYTDVTDSTLQIVDPTDPTTNTSGLRIKVKYALQTIDGVTYLMRDVGICGNSACNTYTNTREAKKVIPYAKTLSLTYYNKDGDEIADTSTQANRNNISFLSVNLVTETKENVKDSGTAKKSFMVETHVRFRNIGIGQVATDSTAPSAPTNVQVRDPGVCGRLKVKWTQSPEGDVAGYKVYYGVATGSYTGVLNIPLTMLSSYSCSKNGADIECALTPTNPALSFNTEYFVAVKAYDNSINHSVYSDEKHGNPEPSSAEFDAGSEDSTINPVKLLPITVFSSVDGASEGQTALSWTYDTAANPGLAGYRIYRSTSPFSSYPIGSGFEIASAGADATSYTDSGLLGCRVYYYAIAPVNCDSDLVIDNGGDPDSKKYIQTDYAATCGDGTNECTPGTGFAAVTGSDTAPSDSGAPSAPGIYAGAGWKRVSLKLDQPGDDDISHTCVYSNENLSTEAGEYPALQTDTATYPKISGCYRVNTTSTPNSIRLYESDGKWTAVDPVELAKGQSATFWHNSMTSLKVVPDLLESGKYSYRAVAFDLCGNGSEISAAQTMTTLCGEDPVGKPPAVPTAAVSSCSSPVELSWEGLPTNPAESTVNTPFDLAGYRIFRAESDDIAGWNASTLLNPDAPSWGTTWNDTTVDTGGDDYRGGSYWYKIITTDCPYEKVNPTESTIRADMNSDTLSWKKVGPVKPGYIDRDVLCADSTAPTDRTCAKTSPSHREVLTGIDIDNTVGDGNNTVTPKSSFKHDTVTLFMNNTSAGTMTVNTANVSWVNSAAYLRKITIGGGRSGMGLISTDIAAASTTTTSSSPYTRAVSNISLTAAQVPAYARYVPITFEFKDSGGNAVDMRDDQLLMNMGVQNDSTGNTNCSTYLTISGSSSGVVVPLGPEVTSVQQDNPASPTFAYAVPGASGGNTVPIDGTYGNIEAIGGIDVKVTANVVRNTEDEVSGGKVGMSAVTVYWAETAITVGDAPLSGYTAATMTNIAGNIWEGTIPARNTVGSAKRVWYYVVAVDNDGNYDRSPEINIGHYTYDQKPFDPCDVTPSKPTGFSGTAGTSPSPYAYVYWNKVTTYTSGSTVNAGDPLVYQVWRRNTVTGSFTKLYEVPDNALSSWQAVAAGSVVAPATSSYYRCESGYCYWWDYIDTTASDLTYYVVAENSCSADANTSEKTSDWRECEGSATATISVSPTSLTAGASYTVTVNDCSKTGGAIDSITVNNIASIGNINYGLNMTESASNVGSFTGTVSTTKVMGESATKVYVSPVDAANDTVTVSCPGCTGPPTSQAVTVIAAPCDFTPAAPTGLSGTKSGSNIDLTWSANTESDLASYKVYRKANAGSFELLATVAAGTTSYSDRPSQINNNDYYYRITAVDSCPLESGASSQVGAY